MKSGEAYLSKILLSVILLCNRIPGKEHVQMCADSSQEAIICVYA